MINKTSAKIAVMKSANQSVLHLLLGTNGELFCRICTYSISEICLHVQLLTFKSVCLYVYHLPYNFAFFNITNVKVLLSSVDSIYPIIIATFSR